MNIVRNLKGIITILILLLQISEALNRASTSENGHSSKRERNKPVSSIDPNTGGNSAKQKFYLIAVMVFSGGLRKLLKVV